MGGFTDRQHFLNDSSFIASSSSISTATMAADMQWGVTPPISLSLPNESEKRSNDALFAELRAQNTYEHAAETQKRYGKSGNLMLSRRSVGSGPASLS